MNQDDIDQAAWAASQPKPPTLSADEMTAILQAAGIPEAAIDLADSDYAMLSQKDITSKLAAAFGDLLFRTGIKWTEDVFDCNAFAMGACFIARLSLAADKERKLNGAPALGIIIVPMHAFCVAVHTNRVAFYEPQPSVPEGEMDFAPALMREIALTPDERASIKRCLFL